MIITGMGPRGGQATRATRGGIDMGGSIDGMGMMVVLGLGENSTVEVDVAVGIINLCMHDMDTLNRSNGWQCQRIEVEQWWKGS